MVVVNFVGPFAKGLGEVDASLFYFFAGRRLVEIVFELDFEDDFFDTEAVFSGGLVEGEDVTGHGFEINVYLFGDIELAGIGEFEEVVPEAEAVEETGWLVAFYFWGHEVDAHTVLMGFVDEEFATGFVGAFHDSELGAGAGGFTDLVGV